MSDSKHIKVAVIDMNNGVPNQGMRGILEILHRYRVYNQLQLEVDVFDIRQRGEIPDLSYNIYISSGGPGSPFDGEGTKWENDFFELLTNIDEYNLNNDEKKHVFLICHSYQLACRKYDIADVTLRKSTAFGIFPMTLSTDGKNEPLFKGLRNPFFAVDSRNWQVVNPKLDTLDKMGAKILAIEKNRPHVTLERCVMAIRFSPYVIGTQFHPEADAIGMKLHFSYQEKKQTIISLHGEAKYNVMIDSLENPNRIMLTQSVILPNFLTNAIGMLHAVS